MVLLMPLMRKGVMKETPFFEHGIAVIDFLRLFLPSVEELA